MVRMLICALVLLGCSDLGDLTNKCTTDQNCDLGRVCVAGECVVECYLDSDCSEGACVFNRCELPVGHPVDGAAADAQTDVSAADAQTDASDPDAQIDASVPDARTDATPADAQPDASEADAQVDANQVDMQTDASAVDAQSDANAADVQTDAGHANDANLGDGA